MLQVGSIGSVAGRGLLKVKELPVDPLHPAAFRLICSPEGVPHSLLNQRSTLEPSGFIGFQRSGFPFERVAR